ncbi:MAG: hypothetical protein IKF64_08480 [Eubacterium sp.]|nr:hypothetical protein [Eubacterium sp.]
MENEKKQQKKRATIRPLIITPIVFVLISMIVIAPTFSKVFGIMKNEVHDAQKTLKIDYNDISVDDEYFKACQKDGTEITRDGLNVCDKVATIECNNAAVGCDVYYGINRVSKRSGAGLSVKQGLFGEGKQIHVDGDVLTVFKALKYVNKGDVFTVKTATEEIQYTVTEITKGEEYGGNAQGEYLLLTTQSSTDAFEYQNKQKLMVVAELGEKEVS